MTNQALIAKARTHMVHDIADRPGTMMWDVEQVCLLAEALLAENATLHGLLDAEEKEKERWKEESALGRSDIFDY